MQLLHPQPTQGCTPLWPVGGHPVYTHTSCSHGPRRRSPFLLTWARQGLCSCRWHHTSVPSSSPRPSGQTPRRPQPPCLSVLQPAGESAAFTRLLDKPLPLEAAALQTIPSHRGRALHACVPGQRGACAREALWGRWGTQEEACCFPLLCRSTPCVRLTQTSLLISETSNWFFF